MAETKIEDYPPLATGKTSAEPSGTVWGYFPNTTQGVGPMGGGGGGMGTTLGTAINFTPGETIPAGWYVVGSDGAGINFPPPMNWTTSFQVGFVVMSNGTAMADGSITLYPIT